MNYFRIFNAAPVVAAVCALAACSSAPRTVEAPASVELSAEAQLAEARAAYIRHFKAAVEGSVAQGQYVRELTLREKNAESCLASRTERLLGRELSLEDRNAILSAAVPAEPRAVYEQLLRGQQYRAYGLETFACEYAGLSVPKTIR